MKNDPEEEELNETEDDIWKEFQEEYDDYILESWESGYFGF